MDIGWLHQYVRSASSRPVREISHKRHKVFLCLLWLISRGSLWPNWPTWTSAMKSEISGTPGKNCRVHLPIKASDQRLGGCFYRELRPGGVDQSTSRAGELLRQADEALYVAKRTGKIGSYLLISQRVCGKP